MYYKTSTLCQEENSGMCNFFQLSPEMFLGGDHDTQKSHPHRGWLFDEWDLRYPAVRAVPARPASLHCAPALFASAPCGRCLQEPAPRAGRSAPSESWGPSPRVCADRPTLQTEWTILSL